MAGTPGFDPILLKSLSLFRLLSSGLSICIHNYFCCPRGCGWGLTFLLQFSGPGTASLEICPVVQMFRYSPWPIVRLRGHLCLPPPPRPLPVRSSSVSEWGSGGGAGQFPE